MNFLILIGKYIILYFITSRSKNYNNLKLGNIFSEIKQEVIDVKLKRKALSQN